MRKYLYSVFFILLLLGLLQAGCVSVSDSPAPRLYMPRAIMEGQEAQAFDFPAGVFIGVGPVRVPEYMNRPQMITRDKDGLLNIAQFERWGEPVDAAVLRMLDENLAVMLPGANTVKLPWSLDLPVKYQVSADIIQMDCELEKNLTVVARWNISDADTRKTLFSRRTEIAQPLITHDYFGLSEALSAAVAALSSQMAQQLSIAAKHLEKKS